MSGCSSGLLRSANVRDDERSSLRLSQPVLAMVTKLFRALPGILLAVLVTTVSYAATPKIDLLGQANLDLFQETTGWHFVEQVAIVPGKMQFRLEGDGGILVNSAVKDLTPYLYTKQEFGDVYVHLEFTLPKGSNSGVYLQGRYEIQIFDSFGVQKPRHADLGGLYERWDESRDPPGAGGVAPRVNAAKRPGAWQTLDITFRGPRFDDDGKKTENATFVKVLVNGQLVHENQEALGPTRAAQLLNEQPRGPILIQGDHGPIAIRRFYVEPLELD